MGAGRTLVAIRFGRKAVKARPARWPRPSGAGCLPAGNPANRPATRLACTLAVLAACCLLSQGVSAQGSGDATALRQIYQNLVPELDHNAFQRQLYLYSEESPSTVKGEIYAVMDYPFTTVRYALNESSQGPMNWCDMLMLHPNIKYCLASDGSSGSTLTVNISKEEAPEKLSSTSRVQFNYDAAITGPEYFQVRLNADSGPLNTRDYRIVMEATALGGHRTFLHLTYAYGYGVVGRLALKGYLATFGRGRIGFTNLADPSAAQPKYIEGVRGLAERNTMRYYLAIDAYLGALSSPLDRRLEQRLSNWFSASEQYPRQLHEIGRQQYMQMKRDEYLRQQTKP